MKVKQRLGSFVFFLLSKKATKNKAARWLGNKSVQKLSDMF